MKIIEIANLIEKTLGVTSRRANEYAKLFRKHYEGSYQAISNMSVKYNYEGRVELTFDVGEYIKHITLDDKELYAYDKELVKRKRIARKMK